MILYKCKTNTKLHNNILRFTSTVLGTHPFLFLYGGIFTAYTSKVLVFSVRVSFDSSSSSKSCMNCVGAGNTLRNYK